MARKTVNAIHFPVGTPVQAFELLASDVERREGRIPIPDPKASGVIDSAHEVEVDIDAGEYILFAVTDEAQEVKVDATAGQFKLTFDGRETADIAFDARADAVQTALEGLDNIDAGDVEVSGGPGDDGGTTPYVVIFRGDLAGSDVAELTARDGTTPLSGGGAAVTIDTTTAGSRGPSGEPLTVIFTVDAV